MIRVLVAEDSITVANLLIATLDSDPEIEVVGHAKNGAEAVEMAKRLKPDLVTMDIQMPVMDGHEATRQIKSSTKGQSITVIALTASVFEHERISVLEDGCDDFIRKPFRESAIFEKLAQHLGVEFVYEEKQKTQPIRVSQAITLDSLKATSSEWISRLHQAASMADSEATLSIIAEIRQNDGGLAAGLQMLVNEFRFDKIVALTQP